MIGHTTRNSRPKAVRWIIVRHERDPKKDITVTFYYDAWEKKWRRGKSHVAKEYKTRAAAERAAFKITVTDPSLSGTVLVKRLVRDLETR
jgi:hypothetical protein